MTQYAAIVTTPLSQDWVDEENTATLFVPKFTLVDEKLRDRENPLSQEFLVRMQLQPERTTRQEQLKAIRIQSNMAAMGLPMSIIEEFVDVWTAEHALDAQS